MCKTYIGQCANIETTVTVSAHSELIVNKLFFMSVYSRGERRRTQIQ